MTGKRALEQRTDRYQCPACGARFAGIFAGLEHTVRAEGNVPLRRLG